MLNLQLLFRLAHFMSHEINIKKAMNPHVEAINLSFTRERLGHGENFFLIVDPRPKKNEIKYVKLIHCLQCSKKKSFNTNSLFVYDSVISTTKFSSN